MYILFYSYENQEGMYDHDADILNNIEELKEEIEEILEKDL